MVVSYAYDFVIGIYTSLDLKSWTHASNFSHHGPLGLQYECPNLVSMPMNGSNTPMYLMVISINPGTPLSGSIMQYFPGSFNGTHFEAVDVGSLISAKIAMLASSSMVYLISTKRCLSHGRAIGNIAK
jgi:beta-fructofuranosidase